VPWVLLFDYRNTHTDMQSHRSNPTLHRQGSSLLGHLHHVSTFGIAPSSPCLHFRYCRAIILELCIVCQQVPVAFGAITFQSANFEQFYVIDGLIGMAFDAGSSFKGTSPLQAMVNAGMLTDEFSMCLNSSSGGVLTLVRCISHDGALSLSVCLSDHH
jgi:hypothetical protein